MTAIQITGLSDEQAKYLIHLAKQFTSKSSAIRQIIDQLRLKGFVIDYEQLNDKVMENMNAEARNILKKNG